MLKIRIWPYLVLQGLWKVAIEKFLGNSMESKVELYEKAMSTIYMSATDIILGEIET